MSMYDESEAAGGMQDAGAAAYVNKAEVRARLVDAIRRHGPALEDG